MFVNENECFFPIRYETVPILKNGIYNMRWNSPDYRVEAAFMYEKFELPSPLLEIDEDFISRICTTFKTKETNMGVLLNGYRGTGKSVHCKIICNRIGIPCFVFSELLERTHLLRFFNELKQPCIIFIDEYEKMYGQSDTLLTLMDGALKTSHKILFLLTSNEIRINENMLNRPTRVHYIKTFGALSENYITELLQLKLDDKTKIKETSQFIFEKIPNVTVDIISTLIEEMNKFNCTIENAVKYMNVTLHENSSRYGIKR